jgi:uncharacterized membrane protein YccC
MGRRSPRAQGCALFALRSAWYHRPVIAPPLRLTHPGFLALKAGLACALALGIDAVTGNPDHISATFVAVLCLTPMVWLGLRRAMEQAQGALLGCVFGGAALLFGVPPWVGVPVAVAATALTWLLLGREADSGFAAAAFTALFVQLAPFGGAGETVMVRAAAVTTGAVSGFIVNVIVSGGFARSIFKRRVKLVRAYVEEHVTTAVRGGPDAIDAVFATVAQLERQLGTAVEELRWRGATDRHHLREKLRDVTALRHLAHAATELYYVTRDSPEARDAVIAWLGGAERPTDPALERAVERLEEARQEVSLRGR